MPSSLAPRGPGLDRRGFLRAGVASALAGLLPIDARAVARHGPPARSVIVVYWAGGLSHLDSFDPKPGAPAEIRGPFRAIQTNLPGVAIGELLPELSRRMNKLTLVRSASHDCDHHEAAANWVLSGRFGSPLGDHPAMGAVVAHELGARGSLPPYFAVPGNPRFAWQVGGSSILGPRFDSYALGARRPGTFDLFPAPSAFAMTGELRSALEFEQESVHTRRRYGGTRFGQNCLLARRLVERGARFVTVVADGWDHHARLREGLAHMLPPFDRGFSALIDDLDARGLLAETLVLACGEFGRVPRVNAAGGRDHWAPAASLLLAGAGLPAGQVIGQTDQQGGHVIDRPVSPADMACTVYQALGIDSAKWCGGASTRHAAPCHPQGTTDDCGDCYSSAHIT